MDKDKAKEYLRFIDEKYTEWYTHPKERTKIAEEIRSVANNWDDEIYLLLNEGRATGLFEHGFFESDIERAFMMLKDIVDEGRSQSVNKMYRIFNILQNYTPALEDVTKKELRDYLIEKIHKGSLKDGRIIFEDEYDFEYFSKLTESIGVNAGELLEVLVESVFV